MADDSARARPRLRPTLLVSAAVLVLLLAAAAIWWQQRPDEDAPDDGLQRVDDACETWMEHRPGMRDALEDTLFGVEGMSEASYGRGGRGVDDHLEDADGTHATLRNWQAASSQLLDSLHLDDTVNQLERELVHRLRGSRSSTRELRELLPEGRAREVLDHREWLEDKLHQIDDVCIRAVYR